MTDIVRAVVAMLERNGLPIVGIGVAERFGSTCPLCRAGMAVEFLPGGVALGCAAGCAEASVLSALREPIA